MYDHDDSEVWAKALTVAVLTSVFFVVAWAVRLVVRTYQKHPNNKVLLSTGAIWLVAVLVAVVLGSIPGQGSLASSLAAMVTVAWLAVVSVMDVVLEERGSSQESLDSFTREPWWPQGQR